MKRLIDKNVVLYYGLEVEKAPKKMLYMLVEIGFCANTFRRA